MDTTEKIKLGKQNKGYKFERTKYKCPLEGHKKDVNRELVFYRMWRDENKKKPGINYGQGVLQDLFYKPERTFSMFHNAPIHIISPVERFVVATVIQWLGTNCGWSFLMRVVDKCGYKIVRK